jgi:hypothetical protein
MLIGMTESCLSFVFLGKHMRRLWIRGSLLHEETGFWYASHLYWAATIIQSWIISQHTKARAFLTDA